MKALLLKDFYMMKKYCRSYLLVMIIFAGLSVFDPTWRTSSLSLLCLMAAMMPVTLLAYDERSHWNEYCAALPYGKWDVVSSKYVLCLINQLAVTAVFAVLWLISGGNDIGEFFMTASVCTVVGSRKRTSALLCLYCYRFRSFGAAEEFFCQRKLGYQGIS